VLSAQLREGFTARDAVEVHGATAQDALQGIVAKGFFFQGSVADFGNGRDGLVEQFVNGWQQFTPDAISQKAIEINHAEMLIGDVLHQTVNKLLGLIFSDTMLAGFVIQIIESDGFTVIMP
jgi:hypothetical protein